MRKALVQIIGITPYCQSRFHGIDKLNKEGADAYEQRTWPNKAHLDDQGNVLIPALALKACIGEAAKFLGMQIPGKGKSTYTKHFQAGVLCVESPIICDKSGNPINHKSLDQEGSQYKGEPIFCSANGQPGAGTRVWRRFPVVHPVWVAEAEFLVIDDVITRDVFETHLKTAGNLIGIGAFRVRNRGIWGRHSYQVIAWEDHDILAA